MLPFLAHHYISDRVPSLLASKGYIRPKENKTYEIKRRYRRECVLMLRSPNSFIPVLVPETSDPPLEADSSGSDAARAAHVVQIGVVGGGDVCVATVVASNGHGDS